MKKILFFFALLVVLINIYGCYDSDKDYFLDNGKSIKDSHNKALMDSIKNSKIIFK